MKGLSGLSGRRGLGCVRAVVEEFLHLRDTVAVQCLEFLIGGTNARLV